MEEKKYEEVGVNYRFFLGWRHAAFAGILVVIYGVVSLTTTVYKIFPNIAWLIPLVSSPIGVLLWMIDYRTQDLYHQAIKAGKALEGEKGGFYTRLSEIVVLPKRPKIKFITHSFALFILFWGTYVALVLVAIYLKLLTCKN